MPPLDVPSRSYCSCLYLDVDKLIHVNLAGLLAHPTIVTTVPFISRPWACIASLVSRTHLYLVARSLPANLATEYEIPVAVVAISDNSQIFDFLHLLNVRALSLRAVQRNPIPAPIKMHHIQCQLEACLRCHRL